MQKLDILCMVDFCIWCVCVCVCVVQDIVRLLFGKDVKDVDVDMVIKKRNEFMADRGKRVINNALYNMLCPVI